MSFPQRPQPASGSPSRDRQHRPYRDTSRRRDYSDDGLGSPEYRRNSRSPVKGGIREHTIGSIRSPPPLMPSDRQRMLEGPRAPSLAPSGLSSVLGRKRSLIKPERNRIDKDHPNYHYRQHAQRMDVLPSETGNDPVVEEDEEDSNSSSSMDLRPLTARGAVDEDMHLGTIRRKRQSAKSENRKTNRRSLRHDTVKMPESEEAREARRLKEMDAARVPNLWNAYCQLITFWCPGVLMRCFGMPAKAQQRAWREKIGLISIILCIAAFVGYITFGFSATVCPVNGEPRLRVNDVGNGYLIINGEAYDLSNSQHPAAEGIYSGANVLYDLPEKYGGMDASFMFQNVNGHCKSLITAASGSDIPTDTAGNLGWYFPCNAYNQDGSSSPNLTISYYLGYGCHLSTAARDAYYGLKAAGDVYYTWSDIKNSSRNLAVWGADVIDLDLLEWFNTTQVSYPAKFDEVRNNSAIRGSDLTLSFSSSEDRQIAKCFSEIIKVGSVDTETIGCIASKVVLSVALAFILSVVISKFVLALVFQWFLSRRYSAWKPLSPEAAKKRAQQIEDWTDDIYQPPPKFDEFSGTASDRSRRASGFLPTTSRFTSPYAVDRTVRNRPQPTTMASQGSTAKLLPSAGYTHASDMSFLQNSRESRGSMFLSDKSDNRFSTAVVEVDGTGPSGFIHEAVVPQPPPEWQPFGYPLAHAICLVTAYSEGAAGIRTTLDSVATTEYPNSHKIILVICDGLIKGHGEDFTTPEIVLGMMRDHTILPDEVEPFSYVAVASGSKRHNMAKVYSGFYDYGDDSNVPPESRERVPMMVIVKCGTPDELTKSKTGNRGKRDSQIILMSFLQKVMFDERMTELEYEMFNGIWKITGISADYYEVVLMVDADTKVFPDSMTHMVSAMVTDPEIMGLCGETKIANKRDSWVTTIQVFEYFISHHLAKSFESVFGGVTCLPGCFSMYRIKAPKGGQNYWVPILANPDIVEHYSENVVDTLHKKNLLLLGEDRYLSTLMLKTFPKRKQVFVPQAVCKTTVPESFQVLLSQRRRWINSTIHNLMELVLVRDLCGTFCFSMQFVVFVDLVGTLVLPAAIAFTIYLITETIIDAVTHKPIPVLPLVLLCLILGLPAVLIVLTASRWSYVLWMFIYLLSLPIWNGVLPLYAFWKFDDFSWGETRKTAGETTKKAGLEYEGEFDSSKITMKRWGDFEQERRVMGAGTVSGRGEGGRASTVLGGGFRQSGYDFI